MIKPYVGILVSRKMLHQMRTGTTGHEAFLFYQSACKDMELTPCYFRLQDIRLSSKTVIAYVYKKSSYHRMKLPLPRVIHNRAIHTKPRTIRKLKQLTKHGVTLFNTINRHSKLKVHKLLMHNPVLRPHLPSTEQATAKSLQDFMKRYDELILKPDNSSIGRGIMMIKRYGERWMWVQCKKHKSETRWIHHPDRLPQTLLKIIRQKRYIVQQRLPLAEYQGRPYDLRVSVQKGEQGGWQVSGIAGKCATKGKFVTNVAQGGTVLSLGELLQDSPHLDVEQIKADVEQFSLHVAITLEPYLVELADLGLDIGITEYGYPLFIECNCRDLRYSFKEGGMIDQWRATYTNPMRYAKFLINQTNK